MAGCSGGPIVDGECRCRGHQLAAEQSADFDRRLKDDKERWVAALRLWGVPREVAMLFWDAAGQAGNRRR